MHGDCVMRLINRKNTTVNHVHWKTWGLRTSWTMITVSLYDSVLVTSKTNR